MVFQAHGSFGFRFVNDPKYTLVTMSGTWNYQGTEVFVRYLKSRIFFHPDQSRCGLLDCRDWSYQTPDCADLIQDMNRFITENYGKLYLAYILAPDNRSLSRYILTDQYREFRSQMTMKDFLSIPEAVSWLNESGFSIPLLSDSDFPPAIPSDEYPDTPPHPDDGIPLS